MGIINEFWRKRGMAARPGERMTDEIVDHLRRYHAVIEGECGVIAEAIQKQFGGELYTLRTPDSPYEHFLVKIGDKFLDGLGEHTEEELLADWKSVGGKFEDAFLEKFEGELEEGEHIDRAHKDVFEAVVSGGEIPEGFYDPEEEPGLVEDEFTRMKWNQWVMDQMRQREQGE